MARVSLVKSFTIGFLRSGRIILGHGHPVRCLSDKSDTSFDQVQSNLKRAEMEKPSAETGHRLVWPDVHGSEFNAATHDTFPATWDFKNNELDVEQLAGLPGPNEADDPYSSSEHEQETWAQEDYQQFLEEFQFGRMLALRDQLSQKLCSSERCSLDSVRENVDFMMQELSQISFMLKNLDAPENNANSMSQEEFVLGNVYSEPLMGSWVYTHPSVSPKTAYADVSNVEEVVREFQQDLESPEVTSEGEGQLSSDQATEALDEVIAADDSPKNTPTKPFQSTPNPNPNPNPNANPNPSKDAKQVPQPTEVIHTYKPFRTIDVPAPKPSQSLCTEANAEQVPVQDETAVEERAENSVTKEGFTFSTQLSESESRILMHMALKQALRDLESGKTNYKATVLLIDDEEQSHGVD